EEGWRYRAMGDIDILDDLTLGWMGERHTDGFMDVQRHAANANTVGGARQRWSASWDVGRWGEWSGSFESVQDRNGVRQRRFGLQQQFWYGSRLRIGIHAEREVVADDYDIGLRFSFPLNRKSTRLNSSHVKNSYPVFRLNKKTTKTMHVSASTIHVG